MKTVYYDQMLSDVYKKIWSEIKEDPSPEEMDEKLYPLSSVMGYINSGDIIADIGCGPGRILKYLRWKGYKCFGIDIEPRALKSISNGRVVCGDIIHIPFKNKKFDKVIALSVIDHFSDAGRRSKIFKGIQGILKEGGIAIICVGNQRSISSIYQRYILMNNFIRKLMFRRKVKKFPAGIVYLVKDFEKEVKTFCNFKIKSKFYVGSHMVFFNLFPFLKKEDIGIGKCRNLANLKLNKLGIFLLKYFGSWGFFNPRITFVLERT